jgi:hypothetical protein
MADFKNLMDGFGIVTVMNVRVYKLEEGKAYTNTTEAFNNKSWKSQGYVLDTLKIANITQEGPTKTITGGQYANPLIKYGKTATMEMQDALGRGDVLVDFFGCEKVEKDENTPGRISVTDKFPGPFAMEGESFFIDQGTGEKVPVYIFIPQFLPDAILNLTQDAEGDATVFDLNGTLGITKIADADGKNERSVFYEIREESFFAKEEA